jgi:hypothetical protein
LNDPVRQTVELSSSHARTNGNYQAELILTDLKVISSVFDCQDRRFCDVDWQIDRILCASAPLRRKDSGGRSQRTQYST